MDSMEQQAPGSYIGRPDGTGIPSANIKRRLNRIGYPNLPPARQVFTVYREGEIPQEDMDWLLANNPNKGVQPRQEGSSPAQPQV